MPKMKITQALSEIKRLNDRIERAVLSINSSELTAVEVNKKLTNGRNIDNFKRNADSVWDSASSLIERLASLKAAIAASNAITEIEWQDKTYTVAELIQLRTVLVPHKTALLKQLTKVREEQIRQEVKVRNEYELKLGQAWGTMSGNTSNQDPSYANFAAEFEKHNLPQLIDPINVQEKLAKLALEIEQIDGELDTLLTISNSVTEIEI